MKSEFENCSYKIFFILCNFKKILIHHYPSLKYIHKFSLKSLVYKAKMSKVLHS